MKRLISVLLGAVGLMALNSAMGQDWPQWRGPNRDGKAPDFKAPATWPKELKQGWKKMVGTGAATPALVGDRLYVFSREGDSEVIRALKAADGSEVWQDKYDTGGATGPASSHAGPRSSVAVANGKVVTQGVRGVLSCLNAEDGKVLWRKDEVKGWPQFFVSSSPVVTDGMVIAQVGGATNGAVVAYDLQSGNEKWKWAGEGTAYASPVLLKANGINAVVAATDKSVVALDLKDGKEIWRTAFGGRGQGGYNASTPLVVDGSTIIISGGGRGTKAIKLEKKGEMISETEVWSNPERAMVFNSPVVKDGVLYGLTQQHEFFALSAVDGKSLWNAPAAAASAAAPAAQPAAGGGRRGGGGGRTSGYGSIVDAGSALLAITPSSELVAFKPGDKEYSEVARIKLSETPTFAHLIAAGNRIFVKDQDSVTVWTVN